MHVEYHRWLIDNAPRLDAYVAAIEAVVPANAVVVDAGAGTGLLSLIAARAGAKRVYAVEAHPIIEVARQNVARSGYHDRIVCIQAEAGSVDLPEPVDVILSDLIGVFGVDLDILRVYEHLVTRFLRPTGRVLPSRIDVFFAPWEAPEIYESVEFWSAPIAGFDLSPMRRLAVHRPLSVVVPTNGELAPAEHYWTLELDRPTGETTAATRTHSITRPGTVHGITGWFRAQLADGIVLDSAPGKPLIPWRQGFLPLEHPLDVVPGDRLELRLTATQEPKQMLLGWSVALHPADPAAPGASFTQHQFLGELFPGTAGSE